MIALIPARGGSRGIPKKNLQPVGGTPLVLRSAMGAKLAGLKPIVSTEDKEIKDLCQANKVDVLWRPKRLATDEANLRDVAIHFRQLVSTDFAIFLPTFCFREDRDIKQAIDLWKNSQRLKPDSLLCKFSPSDHPNLCLVEDGTRGKPHSTLIYRRQERKRVFVVSHYIVIVNADKLEDLDDGFYNESTVFYPLPMKPEDIDTQEDLQIANKIEETLGAQW